MTLNKRQQKMRATAYGASEIATIVGLSRWETPIAVYERKVLEESGGRGSLAADLGTLLEEPVAKLYAIRTGHTLARVDTIRHRERAIAVATPDRAVFTNGMPAAFHRKVLRAEHMHHVPRLLEVKTTDERARKEYGPPGSDEVPEEKLIQVTWQSMVTGVQTVDLAVLFGRRAWDIWTVAYNEDLGEALFEAVLDFDTNYVKARKPPPPDSTVRYGEFLARQYPRPKEPARPATEAEEVLLFQFEQLKIAEGRLYEALQLKKNELASSIGDADGLTTSMLGSLLYRWKRAGRKTDWEKVAREAQLLLGLVIPKLPMKTKAQRALAAEIEIQMKALEEKNTAPDEGYRWFQRKFSGDLAALRNLDLTLSLPLPVEAQPPALPETTTPAAPQESTNNGN